MNAAGALGWRDALDTVAAGFRSETRQIGAFDVQPIAVATVLSGTSRAEFYIGGL